MAENVTPVTLEVKDFEKREVMMIDYKFDQATDREGQIAGIPRGGKVSIRVKAMNDGNSQLLQWMLAPNDPRDFTVTFYNTVDGSTMKELKGTGCYCIHCSSCELPSFIAFTRMFTLPPRGIPAICPSRSVAWSNL